jgi:hypothetical protein
MHSWDGKPDTDFDEEFASGFIGKYVLVGITQITHAGEFIAQEQLHGQITAATPNGIDVELRGAREGEVWRMPPFLEDLCPMQPGIYSLKSSGESIENPDFGVTITIRKSQHQ